MTLLKYRVINPLAPGRPKRGRWVLFSACSDLNLTWMLSAYSEHK
jgi:hypothetical protein